MLMGDEFWVMGSKTQRPVPAHVIIRLGGRGRGPCLKSPLPWTPSLPVGL